MRPQATEVESADSIAIIGMAGRFPGAPTLEAFWENLQHGVESIVRFTPEELAAAGIPAAVLAQPDYVNAGAILQDIASFDAPFFGLNAREATLTDPQQRLFLECAWQALEHAGYDPEQYPGAIGIYAGSRLSTYLSCVQDSGDALSRLQVLLGNEKDYLTSRVSYLLNLTGPSVCVQSACSTSLVAVHLACQSLLAGECDLALAGGVAIRLPHKAGYAPVDGLTSPDGHCRAFAAAAQGTVFGSGLGLVVLKRLAEAQAEGDSIYAIIRGSAVNNDGASKVGYTAPSVSGQARVIAEALAVAGVRAETVTYVEAHGTGTPLGDPIEIAALTQAFQAQTSRHGFCAIGSVKTNIGHGEAAAGIASLIKTVLALRHRLLPPSLHCTPPNPRIDFAHSPFYVNQTLTPWPAETGPRRAGVSSFGLGGTNAHLILEEAPPLAVSGPARAWHLMLLSARTPAALDQATAQLATALRQQPTLNLADVAYTLQVGRRAFGQRRMFVCQRHDDALQALEAPTTRPVMTAALSHQPPSVAFMFPGGGAQYAQMTRELYHGEAVFRDHVDHCAQLLTPHLGLDLRQVLYPSPAVPPAAHPSLTQPSLALPGLFVVSYALAQLWQAWGVQPQAMLGHSLGEYVAACLAGVFTVEDALTLVARRGQLFEQLPAGAMLSVPLSEAVVQPLLGTDLSLAAVNGPALCVVAGPLEAVAHLEQTLAAQAVESHRLPIATAAHSALVESILGAFTAAVQQLTLHAPRLPYVSNVTGTWISASEATSPDYWARHLRQTVRFSAGLRTLLQEPQRLLLEVGPGQTLSLLARHHPATTTAHRVLASSRHPQDPQSDTACLLQALGQLWLAGVPVAWSRFAAHEQRQRVALPTYPFERQDYWLTSPPDPVRPNAGVPVAPTSAPPPPAPVVLASSRVPSDARNDTERQLVDIWQRLLGVAPISIHDHFFALGGHSLLAVQLFAHCAQVFGRRLPLATLFQAPTVAQLAPLLCPDAAPVAWSSLVPMQPEGSRPPFFCLHAESGEVLFYHDFARLLGPEQPVYGLQAQGLDGTHPPHRTIEAMAAHYLAEMRTVQPDGPYFLGGHCYGAIVVLEMAQQLSRQGQSVGLLAVLDGPGPRVPAALRHTLQQGLHALRQHPLALAHHLLWREVPYRFRQLRSHLPRRARPVPPEAVLPSHAVYQSLMQALQQYHPQPYPGRITCFMNSERARLPLGRWQALAAQGVALHVFPGTHRTAFQPPALQAMAAQVQRCLTEAQATVLQPEALSPPASPVCAPPRAAPPRAH